MVTDQKQNSSPMNVGTSWKHWVADQPGLSRRRIDTLLSTPNGWMAYCVTGLFVIGILGGIYVAKIVLLPVVLALFLHLILRPIHRVLLKLHLSHMVSASLILISVIVVLIAGSLYLSQPMGDWLDNMPRDLQQADNKIHELMQSFESVKRVADQVDEITESSNAATPKVTVENGDRLSGQVMAYAQSSLAMATITLMLVFFFLAYGHMLYNKLIREIGPVEFPDEIGPEVSHYLLTITAINVCLGLVIGTVMYFLGMPNPLLWGIMATLLNYIPYLGAIAGVLIVFFAATLSLSGTTNILLIPVSYLVITSIEGSLITPVILGKHFTINPIIIFLWLILWGWLWGVPGAVVAVPLLMAFRIFCEHIPPLAPLVRITSL